MESTSMTSKYMNFSPHLVNERNLALNNCPTKSGRSQIYRTYYLKMKDAYENYEEESDDEYYEEESSEAEDEDDEDYVESEEETDASETEASEADASETEASEADTSEADSSEADSSEAEASEADASEADSSEAESEEEEDKNEFGCAGCNYEWRDGYKNGWRDAMKYIAGKTYKEVPDTPGCSYCAIVCKTRKCGGKCGGTVRYCSINCQKQDWASGHKDKCGKL
jgi:hypothetical protein